MLHRIMIGDVSRFCMIYATTCCRTMRIATCTVRSKPPSYALPLHGSWPIINWVGVSLMAELPALHDKHMIIFV